MDENKTTTIEFEINAQGWSYEIVSSLIKKIREEHSDDCALHVKVNFGNCSVNQ